MPKQYPLQLTGFTQVTINEYHIEVATVLGRAIGRKTDGDTEDWVPVDLGVQSLFNWIQKYSTYPEEWRPDAFRRSSQRKLIQDGNSIDAPVMYSADDKDSGITIIDGRHRISAIQSVGGTTMMVMVPESQVSLFQTKFL